MCRVGSRFSGARLLDSDPKMVVMLLVSGHLERCQTEGGFRGVFHGKRFTAGVTIPIRLQGRMRRASLYAFQFVDSPPSR
jgi:hypothetical protein